MASRISYKISLHEYVGSQACVDCFSLSFRIYGFHTTVLSHPAEPAFSYYHPAIYSPMRSHQNSHALAAAPVLQTVISPVAFATTAWGITGKEYSALETSQDGESGQSRKRYKASPNNKELWRERLCEGSAVEVRWKKDWWNAHVIQVCHFAPLHSLSAVPILASSPFNFVNSCPFSTHTGRHGDWSEVTIIPWIHVPSFLEYEIFFSQFSCIHPKYISTLRPQSSQNAGNEWLCWEQVRCSPAGTAPLKPCEAEIRIRYVGDLDGADDEWLASSSPRLRQPRGWGGATNPAD